MARKRPMLVKHVIYQATVALILSYYSYWRLLQNEELKKITEPHPDQELFDRLAEETYKERFEARRRLKEGYTEEDYGYTIFELIKRSFTTSN